MKSKRRIATITFSTLALIVLYSASGTSAVSAKGTVGGTSGGGKTTTTTAAPAPVVLKDFGPVGSLTPQGVYDYVKATDPALASSLIQIQTNAPTDLHITGRYGPADAIGVCNTISAYVYGDRANADVRVIIHTDDHGAIWAMRLSATDTCQQ